MTEDFYPEGDVDFWEEAITNCDLDAGLIETDSGMFWFPDGAIPPVVPAKVARFYGPGPHQLIRGLFVDGRRVFYRSHEEQERRMDEQKYGKDSKSLVETWDRGGLIMTLSMGGLGPSYEQALQIAMIEALRILNDSGLKREVEEVRGYLEEGLGRDLMETGRLNGLGLSGAQVYAGIHLAAQLYIFGPVATLKKENEMEPGRLIYASRGFPQAPPPPMEAVPEPPEKEEVVEEDLPKNRFMIVAKKGDGE